jgi:hypothetical protein
MTSRTTFFIILLLLFKFFLKINKMLSYFGGSFGSWGLPGPWPTTSPVDRQALQAGTFTATKNKVSMTNRSIFFIAISPYFSLQIG